MAAAPSTASTTAATSSSAATAAAATASSKMLSQLKKKLSRFTISRDEGPVCDSGIYCYGPLLDAVQMSALYPDSKTFVDKKLKQSPGKIIKRFDDLVKSNDGKSLTKEQIKEFVEANFDDEGLELELWTPEDWSPEPSFLQELRNPQLRGLAKRINRLWKDLSRRIKDEVKENPQLYSIIYVPNGFIVPGGRFREFYYWDTYWIVKALLRCDMAQTVRGIIENFLLMVKTYGLVPNGGRIYYTKRSQPPFLPLMMKEYMAKTAEVDFLRQHMATFEREIDFWERRRSLLVETEGGVENIMFVYGTGGNGPRPESYREDVELGEEFETEEEREEFYFHMKAGAESGWDYSTRWMIDAQGKAKGGLKAVRTNFIVPVDLNSVMHMNYVSMAEFYSLLGDAERSECYMEKAEALQKSIRRVLWSDEERMWFDYDFLNRAPRKSFYPSNLFPLWAECFDASERMLVAEASVAYLKRTGAIYCKGGVPTSVVESGQQWDFPNAWPPLQHILVEGLLKTEHSEAKDMALTVARRYTEATMFSCPDGAEVCNMFEKYDVNGAGAAGGGGEYEVQTGFGWSNGVVIEFIGLFGDQLIAGDQNDTGSESALVKTDDLYDASKLFKEKIELNTHFDAAGGKSKLVKRESNVFLAGKPGSQEDAGGGGNMLSHPALSIEEDDTAEGEDENESGDRLDGAKNGKKRISNKDVNIVTQDGIVGDIDLQIEIPKEKLNLPPLTRNNTLRRRVRNFLQKVTSGSTNEVIFIRDVITVKAANGATYDLDLDLKVELEDGRRCGSGADSQTTDEDSRLSDCGGAEEAASAAEESAPRARGRGRPRWMRTGSAIKSRLSRSKSSILRRSQLLVRPLSEGLRRAWRNSQDIEDHDSSDQDVSLAPAGNNAGSALGDVSNVARSCIDLSAARETCRGGLASGDSTSTLVRPHMRSTADLFRFTTV